MDLLDMDAPAPAPAAAGPADLLGDAQPAPQHAPAGDWASLAARLAQLEQENQALRPAAAREKQLAQENLQLQHEVQQLKTTAQELERRLKAQSQHFAEQFNLLQDEVKQPAPARPAAPAAPGGVAPGAAGPPGGMHPMPAAQAPQATSPSGLPGLFGRLFAKTDGPLAPGGGSGAWKSETLSLPWSKPVESCTYVEPGQGERKAQQSGYQPPSVDGPRYVPPALDVQAALQEAQPKLAASGPWGAAAMQQQLAQERQAAPAQVEASAYIQCPG